MRASPTNPGFNRRDHRMPDIINQLDDRILGVQSWFIASELIRRHPKLKLIQTYPHWGVHDCLSICDVASQSPTILIELARTKFIWVRSAADQDASHIEWIETLRVQSSANADDPHSVLKRIEALAGLHAPSRTPVSTPAVLTHRVSARTLSLLMNDRSRWDVQNEFYDADDSTMGSARRHWTDSFPTAARSIEDVRSDDLLGNPAYRYWALLRDGAPVAILDTDGTVHLKRETHSLLDLYRGMNRSLTRVIAAALGSVLP